MGKEVQIGNKIVGNGHPVYIVAEVGINHNGDLGMAKRLIDSAVSDGCDAVKFQKRTPELCIPKDQRDIMRETPWGYVSYMEYRNKIELGLNEYREIDQHCRQKKIAWFASCWDIEAINFMEAFNPPCYKVPSASLTDQELLKNLRGTGRPIILSTGMSTIGQIREAVKLLGTDNLIITHCTSTYPCPSSELNLKMITTLKKEFDCLIGYSGHEVGLPTTVAAVALGACLVERHITLERSLWGSDQSASVEPRGFERLVHYIRVVEEAMGDGIKKVYESELPILKRLRKVQ